MSMSTEMAQMLSIIKIYDNALRNKNDTRKCYFTPDIPEKVMRALIKEFDAHLPINSIIAFYDETLFNNCKSGIIFTDDGFYYRGNFGKAFYVRYADIQQCLLEKSTLVVNLKNGSSHSIISALDTSVMMKILDELIDIDRVHGQSSNKASGTIQNESIPRIKLLICHGIIHSVAAGCGLVGAGFAQIPAADNMIITPAQIGMITTLGKVFDLNIGEAAAKSIFASCAASVAGRTATQVLWGWIPGAGNVINTATAAGLTEFVGWMAVDDFFKRSLEDKNKGRYEGMKDGYAQASAEYERKLRKQAEEFLKQQRDFQKEREAYETLLSDYEAYIQELQYEQGKSDVLKAMKSDYESLKKLQSK